MPKFGSWLESGQFDVGKGRGQERADEEDNIFTRRRRMDQEIAMYGDTLANIARGKRLLGEREAQWRPPLAAQAEPGRPTDVGADVGALPFAPPVGTFGTKDPYAVLGGRRTDYAMPDTRTGLGFYGPRAPETETDYTTPGARGLIKSYEMFRERISRAEEADIAEKKARAEYYRQRPTRGEGRAGRDYEFYELQEMSDGLTAAMGKPGADIAKLTTERNAVQERMMKLKGIDVPALPAADTEKPSFFKPWTWQTKAKAFQKGRIPKQAVYKTPEDVRVAHQARRISDEEARKILLTDFPEQFTLK